MSIIDKKTECYFKCSSILNYPYTNSRKFSSLGTEYDMNLSKIIINSYNKCYEQCINGIPPLELKDNTIGGHK